MAEFEALGLGPLAYSREALKRLYAMNLAALGNFEEGAAQLEALFEVTLEQGVARASPNSVGGRPLATKKREAPIVDQPATVGDPVPAPVLSNGHVMCDRKIVSDDD